jgi:hypothetical protein
MVEIGAAVSKSVPKEVSKGRLSSYSRGETAEGVDASKSVGDCTISRRNDGSSGAGANPSASGVCACRGEI